MRPDALATVAHTLRNFLRETTEDKAGHLASSLGVAELTVALHALLHCPEDILIWDVGLEFATPPGRLPTDAVKTYAGKLVLVQKPDNGFYFTLINVRPYTP